jgi:hypothetical protein
MGCVPDEKAANHQQGQRKIEVANARFRHGGFWFGDEIDPLSILEVLQ